MGSNQEIPDVDHVNVSSDGSMVVGRVCVLEYGSSIGCDPDKTKDGGVHGGGGGSVVVQRE